MLAESMRAFVNRYAVLPGRHRRDRDHRRVRLHGWRSTLKTAGMDVTVVDLRREPRCGPEFMAAVHAGSKF